MYKTQEISQTVKIYKKKKKKKQNEKTTFWQIPRQITIRFVFRKQRKILESPSSTTSRDNSQFSNAKISRVSLCLSNVSSTNFSSKFEVIRTKSSFKNSPSLSSSPSSCLFPTVSGDRSQLTRTKGMEFPAKLSKRGGSAAAWSFVVEGIDRRLF